MPTETQTLETRDLVEKLQDKQFQPSGKTVAGLCYVTLTNQCPPEWGVVIVSGGVKFFNDDGTDYTDGPKPLNVPSGHSTTFVSKDPNKCVHQYFLAINVRVGNEQQSMTHQDGVEPGECMLHVTLTLGPTKSVRKDFLKKDKGNLIEVTVAP
jgi:hypothetical protein